MCPVILRLYLLKINNKLEKINIITDFLQNQISKNKIMPFVIEINNNNISENIKDFIKFGYDSYDNTFRLNLQKIKKHNNFTKAILNYEISDYNINSVIKTDSIDKAKRICIENNYSGITYIDNIFEIRNGKTIKFTDDEQGVISFILF